MKKRLVLGLCVLALGFGVFGCGDDTTPAAQTHAGAEEAEIGSAAQGLNPAHLLEGGLVTAVTTEPCTLSGGTETECYRIVVTSQPSEHTIGPFCPRNISDGADAGGIWFESGQVHDVDGAFVQNLATFYSDDAWQLFDPETGAVHVTDTAEACAGAARPDVAEEYQNHCVECDVSYVEGGTVATYLIPVTPVRSTTPISFARGALGLALNGVNFDPPAPTAAILGAHTIAALDDCGGHVNPVTGYHYHAVTGCGATVAQDDGHAALIGYALDGYGIYAMAGEDGIEPADLDGCRGHEDDVRGYHYHVASPGENVTIGCFGGEHGCHVEGTSDAACDATAMVRRGPPGGGPPGGGPLGGGPPGGGPPGGGPPGGGPEH